MFIDPAHAPTRWYRACVAPRTLREFQSQGLFAVPTDQPGYQVTNRLQKMGWHCSDTAEFGLVDARSELIIEQGFASRPALRPLKGSPGRTGYATAARCVDLTREWIIAK